MRFNCGPTPQERYHMKLNWHDYFLLWPIRINGECVWLETVERRGRAWPHVNGEFSGWVWKYRIKEEQ